MDKISTTVEIWADKCS